MQKKCKGCPLTAPEGKEYCVTCELIVAHEGEQALIKPKQDIGPFEKRLSHLEKCVLDLNDMLTVILVEWNLYDRWLEQRKYRLENEDERN